MDTQAKTLTSPQPDTAKSMTSSHSHNLTLVKYLPLSAFKTTVTLTEKLNDIQRELHSSPRNNLPEIMINLAKNIALTTIDMNTDYKSKLDLIQTARVHPIFNSQNIIIRIANTILKLIPIKSWHHLLQTQAQSILNQATVTIRQKKDCIILC